MTLTKTERALLANQNRILALLDESNSQSYLNNVEIAVNGYEGLYDQLIGVSDEEISKEICEETHEILTMYRGINGFIRTLTSAESESLDLTKINFAGFDANNDSHYFFMKFIVEKQDLYEEYRDSYLNSHSIGTIEGYRRMLAAYKTATSANHGQLNLIGLQEIINSRR